MDLKDAQAEMRKTYLHGFASFIISGNHWLLTAIIATWISQKVAIIVIVFGGLLIFPATKLLLTLMKIPDVVSKENPLNELAIQTAFIIPLSLPLVFIAADVNDYWFLPTLILLLGVHYLPFITLYGSKFFGFVAGVLITIGYLLIYFPFDSFAVGGWIVAIFFFSLAIFIWIKAGKKYVTTISKQIK